MVTEGTVARMAGNILASLVAEHTYKELWHGGLTAKAENYVALAVTLAQAIATKVAAGTATEGAAGTAAEEK